MNQTINKTRDIQYSVDKIIPLHFSYLKKEPAFPRECVLSSHLLYAFLKAKPEDIEIIYEHMDLGSISMLG